MQLQTQVPQREWSSAAATSIHQPQLVLLTGFPKQQQQHADRFSKHLQQNQV